LREGCRHLLGVVLDTVAAVVPGVLCILVLEVAMHLVDVMIGIRIETSATALLVVVVLVIFRIVGLTPAGACVATVAGGSAFTRTAATIALGLGRRRLLVLVVRVLEHCAHDVRSILARRPRPPLQHIDQGEVVAGVVGQHVGRVQEAIGRAAEADERRADARLDVDDPPLVDVA
jgi:hypothetical protein